MTAANFAPSLAAVLVHEGGFVCNPNDPGGATCKGVTQAVYDDWRASHGLCQQTVRAIAEAEVEAIYFKLYWNAIKADDLPSGVDYCAFDFAFNSGPNQAVRFLQRTVGAREDGKVGPATLAAAKDMPPLRVIDRLCDERLRFLQSLPTWKFFGKGWSRRVTDVRLKAKEMAS
jgi:lysozyme family protein